MPFDDFDPVAYRKMSDEVYEFVDGLHDNDLFDGLLGRNSFGDPNWGIPHALEAEHSHLETAYSLMNNLVVLCGSKEKARAWLAHSPTFAVAESAYAEPMRYIVDGDFWTLALLDDILHVIIAGQTLMPRATAAEVFGFAECADPTAPFNFVKSIVKQRRAE